MRFSGLRDVGGGGANHCEVLRDVGGGGGGFGGGGIHGTGRPPKMRVLRKQAGVYRELRNK